MKNKITTKNIILSQYLSAEIKKDIHNYSFTGRTSYAFRSTEKLENGNITI